MLTKEIQGKVKILMVDLKEDLSTAENFEIINDHLIFYKHNGHIIRKVKLPPGRWRFLNILEQMTATDAEQLVDKNRFGYKRYWKDNGFVPRGFNHRYESVFDSIESLLKSNDIRTVNEYGTYEDNIILGDASALFKAWRSEESKIYKPKTTLILTEIL